MNLTDTHEIYLQLIFSALDPPISSELTIALELLDGAPSSEHLFFPPSSAPYFVKKAFSRLSKEEQMDIRWLTLNMYAHKNLRMDEWGRLTVLDHDDPTYINIHDVLRRQDFNYWQYLEELVEYTEQIKNLVSEDSHEKWMKSVNKFKHALME